MIYGYLRGSGIKVQRQRVRDSLTRVDALGSAARWSRTVTRRTYKVPTPNSLWHFDGHMKLVRYVFMHLCAPFSSFLKECYTPAHVFAVLFYV